MSRFELDFVVPQLAQWEYHGSLFSTLKIYVIFKNLIRYLWARAESRGSDSAYAFILG